MAKKGGSYICAPCGMEVLITESGSAYSEILCCGQAMAPKPRAKAKKKTTNKEIGHRQKSAGEEKGRKKEGGPPEGRSPEEIAA